MKRDLIIHLPVIHRGYLDFFEKNKEDIDNIYILDNELLAELSEFKPDIASLQPKEVCQFLGLLGFSNLKILSKDTISAISKPVMLIQDEVSRALKEKYLPNLDIEWKNVFLRWDRSAVLATKPLDEKSSTDSFDQKMMSLAYKNADNSSDWWRQVGAVLVRQEKRAEIEAYNESLPNDHAPYQMGAIRDYLNVGERPELSNTIHAEQKIIAEAAKQGISLAGSSLYVTHFPCAVCAKLIACAGIKKCFFAEGSANLDGKTVMESAGVEIRQVKQ